MSCSICVSFTPFFFPQHSGPCHRPPRCRGLPLSLLPWSTRRRPQQHRQREQCGLTRHRCQQPHIRALGCCQGRCLALALRPCIPRARRHLQHEPLPRCRPPLCLGTCLRFSLHTLASLSHHHCCTSFSLHRACISRPHTPLPRVSAPSQLAPFVFVFPSSLLPSSTLTPSSYTACGTVGRAV